MKIDPISTTTKLDSEPPTKMIKLINGNTIVMDKEQKFIPSTQLTLSQVVVSQLPLITSSQGHLRVIGQAPNGMATIELSNPNVQTRTLPSQGGQHQATIIPNGTNGGAQLQKLLVSSNGTTAVTTTAMATPELARLPGGAELNILPTGTNGTFYRNNGKLAIVNNQITIKGKRYGYKFACKDNRFRAYLLMLENDRDTYDA